MKKNNKKKYKLVSAHNMQQKLNTRRVKEEKMIQDSVSEIVNKYIQSCVSFDEGIKELEEEVKAVFKETEFIYYGLESKFCLFQDIIFLFKHKDDIK